MIAPQAVIANPGAFAGMKDCFKTILIDNPNEEIPVKGGAPFEFDELLAKIESAEVENRPRIADAAEAFFRKEIQALEGSAARVEACRAELADPERRNTFRKLAAMEMLIESNGSKALVDLAPYFGSDYWRLRNASRELAAGLVKSGGGAVLADLLGKSGDPRVKAGILHVFAQSGDKSGIEAARNGLKDGSPLVRGAAARTLSTLGGESALAVLIAQFATARDPGELAGFDGAFLVGTANAKRAALVRDSLIKALPGMDAAVKPCAWNVLAQIGDSKSIAALKNAAGTNNTSEFSDIVMALSYSPSREADRVLLEIAAAGKKQAGIVGSQAVRRMVLGPKGYGDITDAERMDFVEPMVKLDMDGKLVKYLGGVRDVRALRALMDCLRRGYTDAAESLVRNAEKMDNLTEAENKVALEAIKDVIEYIEVSHLRGGVKAHMSYKYPIWKSLQARAGKVMLKLHQPEKAPIKGFESLELDR